MWKWIKGLFASPKTTAAGIATLALTGLKCYGMATGKIPVDVATVAEGVSMLSAGAGLLMASDSKTAQVVNTVSEVATAAAPLAAQVQEAIQAEGEKAKADKIAELAAQVAGALPK